MRCLASFIGVFRIPQAFAVAVLGFQRAWEMDGSREGTGLICPISHYHGGGYLVWCRWISGVCFQYVRGILGRVIDTWVSFSLNVGV
jgi:hypothetical protein